MTDSKDIFNSVDEVRQFFANDVYAMIVFQMRVDGIHYLHPIAIGKTALVHGITGKADTEEELREMLDMVLSDGSKTKRIIVGTFVHRRNVFKFFQLDRAGDTAEATAWVGGKAEIPIDKVEELLDVEAKSDYVAPFLEGRAPSKFVTYEEMLSGNYGVEASSLDTTTPPLGGIN